ncbi:LacI family DNA-binding transcriptional regulator [Microbacterium horticulturae]|uniref:LacI family DNA-binding transcriptional regulator n=1 Tax=Microbacterium horticulturae TaxID=3028316 RepID=A0ABY8BWF7_9MICO|nr:LacI family DNA-binding transcriptional regulator [Microbacterium sp. KACC 23027]WEG08530.1 LacI family DNA-binding transcriptional regulator [Microbacterium sp. KACC 23027]
MEDEPTLDKAPRRATMKDVAARAGVGLSTVSRVVSGKGGVAAAKVRAVEKAVRELNFSRNDSAHTLRTGSSATVGMVVTNISDPFFSALIKGVEERARERDLVVLVTSVTDAADEAERVIRRLLRRSLDGLILVAPEGSDLGFLQEQTGTPVVFVDQPPSDHVTADLVLVDNEGGAVSAVEHLYGAGHRRIACFAHESGRYTSVRREAGYYQALRRLGLPSDRALVVSVEDDVNVCAEALLELSRLPDPPTAIFSTNGRTTRALLGAQRLLGSRLALVGFDDFDLAELMDPPTTTIAQDPVAIGAAAADLLLSRIDGRSGPTQRIILGTRLVERGSGELPPHHD